MMPTIATRAQSIASAGSASLMIGAKRCCARAAGRPKTRNADGGRDVGVQHLERRDAADPHHRRRRVADDAARRRPRSRPRRSPRGSRPARGHGTACAPSRRRSGRPAMLSRKPETTNTIASSASAPVQSSGSQAGIAFGRPLSSKCAASSAKPTSSRKRFTRITHSWAKCAASPPRPGPAAKPVTSHLQAMTAASPAAAIGSARRWNSATPTSVTPKIRNSTGKLSRPAASPSRRRSARQPPFSGPSRRGRARSGPGRAAVGSPFSSASTPFTMTCETPVAYWCGSA